MNAMKYLMDPEMSPLVSKAVAKLNMWKYKGWERTAATVWHFEVDRSTL
jgi:hypothetical protein